MLNYVFAVLLVMFLMSSGPYLLCCFFSCCYPPWPWVSEYAPRDLLCPSTPNFPWSLCHNTPIRPKQPMCEHMRPLCAHTYGYDCARVCLRFCVFVACTIRVCMCVFGLAGAYIFAFCAFYCVCDCSVCLSMFMHMYFVFVCVCLYVYIFAKIRVYR